VRYWFLVTDLKYTLMLCFSSFQTVDIKVKMDCDGCERRVKNSVSSMKGTNLKLKLYSSFSFPYKLSMHNTTIQREEKGFA